MRKGPIIGALSVLGFAAATGIFFVLTDPRKYPPRKRSLWEGADPPELRRLRITGAASRGKIDVKIVEHPSGEGYGVVTTVAGDRRLPTEPPMSIEEAQAFALEQLDNPRPAWQPTPSTPKAAPTPTPGSHLPYVPVGDLIERYKQRGLDRQAAWRQYVRDTVLQRIARSEEIDAREFFRYFDRRRA